MIDLHSLALLLHTAFCHYTHHYNFAITHIITTWHVCNTMCNVITHTNVCNTLCNKNCNVVVYQVHLLPSPTAPSYAPLRPLTRPTWRSSTSLTQGNPPKKWRTCRHSRRAPRKQRMTGVERNPPWCARGAISRKPATPRFLLCGSDLDRSMVFQVVGG